MRALVAFLLLAVVLPTTRSSSDTPRDNRPYDDASYPVDGSPEFKQVVSSGETFRRGIVNSATYRLKTTTTNLMAKELGGEAASDPACCSAGVDATYCFIRAFDGYAHYKQVGKKGSWMSLGVWALGDVGCVAHGTDVTVLMIDSNSKRLVSNTLSKGKLLKREFTYAYSLQEVPGCTAMGSDIACMYRGIYGISFLIYRTKNVWGPPLPQGGLIYSPIGLHYSDATKELNAFATNEKYHMQIYSKTPSSMALLWKQEGTFVMSGRPSITSHGPGKILDIFTSGPSNNLLWLRRDASGKYLDWLNEGGNIDYPPVCLGSLNRIDCYSVSPTFYMAKKIWNGTKWTRWENVAWGYVGKPSCHFVDSTKKSVSCYVRSVETTGIEGFTFHA